jgi:hypothetical protein
MNDKRAAGIPTLVEAIPASKKAKTLDDTSKEKFILGAPVVSAASSGNVVTASSTGSAFGSSVIKVSPRPEASVKLALRWKPYTTSDAFVPIQTPLAAMDLEEQDQVTPTPTIVTPMTPIVKAPAPTKWMDF